MHAGDPLAVEDTPRPRTEAEAWALATEERFAQYQQRGGSSASSLPPPPTEHRPNTDRYTWRAVCPTRPRARVRALAWRAHTPCAAPADEARTCRVPRGAVIDHYFDKLLQVARPPADLVRNPYLEAAMQERAAPLLDVCLTYGRTGEVPVHVLDALAERLGLRPPPAIEEPGAKRLKK
jgi:hypothetical protein